MKRVLLYVAITLNKVIKQLDENDVDAFGISGTLETVEMIQGLAEYSKAQLEPLEDDNNLIELWAGYNELCLSMEELLVDSVFRNGQNFRHLEVLVWTICEETMAQLSKDE